MESLRKFVKTTVAWGLHLLCWKKIIIFESAPDFSDNTFAVYEEMIRRGIHRKYTVVWACTEKYPLPGAPRNTRYIYPLDKSFWQKLRSAYYMAGAECMICCNLFLKTWRKKQTSFYLSHGTPMKNVRSYYVMPSELQYCLAAAPGVEKMVAWQFGVPEEKMFSLGFPRNDILTQPPKNIQGMLQTDCCKIVVWYPTFRQHKNGRTAGSGKALPIIHNVDAAQRLNAWAQEKDVLLVLKPHFAQNVADIKDLSLSNIRFIDDGFFRQNKITSYEFVASCDAMITDYSSIYYDYMLCDKPIGLVWEDIQEYQETPGFAVDIEAHGKGGVKIYTLEDFQNFLQEVAESVDSCRQERRVLRDLVNYAPDGKNSKRVVDFIIDKAGLEA